MDVQMDRNKGEGDDTMLMRVKEILTTDKTNNLKIYNRIHNVGCNKYFTYTENFLGMRMKMRMRVIYKEITPRLTRKADNRRMRKDGDEMTKATTTRFLMDDVDVCEWKELK